MLPREPGDPPHVGRFHLVARLGVGGMAIVYFGRSTTGRAAAIKVMHREFARRPDYRARFQREIAFTQAAGGRYSPGVLDADPNAEIPWLAIEFLPSVSLRDAVRAHGPFPSAWGLATGIAEALGAVHAAGILHLDLKPANVLLTADGPRLIDFGIAAVPGTATAPAGSPGYMSPEQLTGGSLGPASDVYSFGATLAFAAGDTADEDLRALITRCLQPDPAARPTVPELRALPSSTDWLPSSVDEEIRRRTAEAVNPPVPADPPRPVSRRGLLIGLGALLTAAAAGTAAALWPHPQVHQQPTTTRPPAPVKKTTTTTTPTTSQLQLYVFGTTTPTSLTTVINGQSETVTNPALPWSRYATIPVFPTHTDYSVTYTISTGNITWKALVDGYEYGSGGASTTDQDYTHTDTGTI